jgi:hypothetical protein
MGELEKSIQGQIIVERAASQVQRAQDGWLGSVQQKSPRGAHQLRAKLV